MRPNEEEDTMFAALRGLPDFDIDADRVERLRSRCHRRLQAQHGSYDVPPNDKSAAWLRAAYVVGGAWCAVYVFETIRRAAAVYWV
jgi:hypothetical protein